MESEHKSQTPDPPSDLAALSSVNEPMKAVALPGLLTPVDPAKGDALLKKLFGTRPLPIVQEDDSPRQAKPKT